MMTDKFHQACARGDISKVEQMLKKGIDINIKDEEGYSGIHWATQEGQIHLVQFLLQNGAEVNSADNLGFTPLVIASSEGHKELVTILIDAGGDIHHKVHSGGFFSAIHNASAYGKKEIVEILLSKGANPTDLDGEGMSPLDHAILNEENDVATILRSAIKSRV